jgi:hypothetical protein
MFRFRTLALALVIVVWGPGMRGTAETLTHAVRCAVCQSWINEGMVFSLTDRVEGQKKYICAICDEINEHCALCLLPVKGDYTRVGDGRFLCSRDAKTAVLDNAEALRICQETRVEMGRAFSRFTVFPGTNVILSIEDQLHMDMVLQSPGFNRQCPYLTGYTVSARLHDNRWEHRIGILGAMPRSRLMAVTAHELGHAWMKEHLPQNRRMLQVAAEGFCELIAYRLMDSLGEKAEIRQILANNYTQGQIQLFIGADRDYDFLRVMDWVQYGEDLQLYAMEPDRVRRLDPALRLASGGPPAPALFPPAALGPAPLPESLTLNGLLGRDKNRLAVINDCTLAAGEAGRVRLRSGEVRIRCLEARTNSVLVQVEGEESPRELVLRGRQSE